MQAAFLYEILIIRGLGAVIVASVSSDGAEIARNCVCNSRSYGALVAVLNKLVVVGFVADETEFAENGGILLHAGYIVAAYHSAPVRCFKCGGNVRGEIIRERGREPREVEALCAAAGACGGGIAVNAYEHKGIFRRSISRSVRKGGSAVYGIHHIHRCPPAFKLRFEVFADGEVDFVFTVCGKVAEGAHSEGAVTHIHNNGHAGKAVSSGGVIEAENEISALIIGIVAEEAALGAEIKAELGSVPCGGAEKRRAAKLQRVRN